MYRVLFIVLARDVIFVVGRVVLRAPCVIIALLALRALIGIIVFVVFVVVVRGVVFAIVVRIVVVVGFVFLSCS